MAIGLISHIMFDLTVPQWFVSQSSLVVYLVTCLLQRDERRELVLRWKWHHFIDFGGLTSASTSTRKCIENLEVLHMKMLCRDTGMSRCVVCYCTGRPNYLHWGSLSNVLLAFCLSVCQISEKYWTDFDDVFEEKRQCASDKFIRFWRGSDFIHGSFWSFSRILH